MADANPVLWARAEFLASLLEEELGSATRAHMRARPLSLAVGFPEDLAERSANPAFFALLAAGKSDIVFACNPLTTQALADASLGAGHMSLQPRGTLSYFDKELVRRCLDGLPQMIERAFALPPCKMSRIVWYADDIFLTVRNIRVYALRLSLAIDGLAGECLLLLPLELFAKEG